MATPKVTWFCLVFSSRSFTVWYLTFKLTIYFELILEMGVKSLPRFLSFACGRRVAPALFVGETPPAPRSAVSWLLCGSVFLPSVPRVRLSFPETTLVVCGQTITDDCGSDGRCLFSACDLAWALLDLGLSIQALEALCRYPQNKLPGARMGRR